MVGEELSSALDHHNRAGGAERSELLSVSQLTPRISVFQGLFDELEFSDWYYEILDARRFALNCNDLRGAAPRRTAAAARRRRMKLLDIQ